MSSPDTKQRTKPREKNTPILLLEPTQCLGRDTDGPQQETGPGARLSECCDEDGLDGVEAVFGLVEDDAGW